MGFGGLDKTGNLKTKLYAQEEVKAGIFCTLSPNPKP